MKKNLTLNEFENIYELYKGIVYGITIAMLKTKKDAVSVTNKVFTEIIHEAYLYKKDELMTGIFKSTYDKCNAILKGETTPTDWTAVWDKVVEEKPDDTSPFATDDELLKLFPQLTEFDVKQRAVFILSVAKLDLQTIADIMDIPKQTVEWLQSQNKKEMKDAGVASYSKYLKDATEVLNANEPALKLKITDAYSNEFGEEEKKSYSFNPMWLIPIALAVIVVVGYFLLK